MRKLSFAAFLAVFILFLHAAAFAQPAAEAPKLPSEPKDIQKILDEKQKLTDALEAEILSGEPDTQALLGKRQSLKDLRTEVMALVEAIKPQRARVAADLQDLGPPPQTVEGTPAVPEPEAIAQLRTQLGEQSRVFEGLSIQADALVSKSLRLQERISSLRRENFLSRILERQPPPLSPELWAAASENFASQTANFSAAAAVIDEHNPSYNALIFSIGIFIAVLIAARTYSLRALTRRIQADAERGVRRPFTRASASALISMIVATIGLFFIQQSFFAQGVIHEGNAGFATQLIMLSGFMIFAFIVTGRFKAAGIIRTATQWIACLTGLLFAVDQIVLEFTGNMGAGVEFAILQSYIFTSLFALLILTGSVFAYRAGSKKYNFFLPKQAFLFFAFGAGFLLVANFFGYVALSRIVFEKCVVLVSFLTFILMIRALARSFLRQIDNAFHKPVAGGDKQEEERLLLFWLGFSLDLVIVSLCLPLTAGLVGVEWPEVQEAAIHAFWGFNVGNVNISFANIAVGLGVFLALLFVTRMFQKVLNDKILPKTRLESSIRQSLIQLLGYLGLIISMMAGISAVGFDLSNLALIAGALSVGIGFGLQSIVSNFVSGLILLFERPIKVGDWVIVNSGEGIVKKISVRATEIETFDKTSIIVPNSELISSSVKNWNYNDRTGRIIIPLGVSYNSDPRRVREILMECAREHPSVLAHPVPIVVFKDFADSALLFELRVIVRNIREGIDVATDLRFMIWDKLKEEGIEIPYPQRDLNVKADAKILEFLEHTDSLKVKTGHG